MELIITIILVGIVLVGPWGTKFMAMVILGATLRGVIGVNDDNNRNTNLIACTVTG